MNLIGDKNSKTYNPALNKLGNLDFGYSIKLDDVSIILSNISSDIHWEAQKEWNRRYLNE
jgi:hypothetical protein